MRSYPAGQRPSQRHALNVSALARAVAIASSTHGPTARLQAILDDALRATGARRGCVFLLDRSSGVYRVLTHIGLRDDDALVWTVPAGRVPDASGFHADALLAAPYARTDRVASALIAPIVVRGVAAGVICLFERPDEPFDEVDREYLNAIGAIAAALVGELKDHREMLRSEFIGMLGHELRTPLTSIKGATALLMEQMNGAADGKTELLEMVRDNSERLLRLINDLLDATTLEAGRSAIRKRSCDPTPLLEAAATGIRGYADAYGVTVRTDLEPDLVRIVADPDRVEQILSNLLSNAVKFSHKGGQVVLRAQPTGNFLRVEVEDQGVGIAEADLPRLFEKFTQLESSRRNGPGTGLGLAITKGLVEGHGGTISVSSRLDTGSTFSFTLPFAKRADD